MDPLGSGNLEKTKPLRRQKVISGHFEQRKVFNCEIHEPFYLYIYKVLVKPENSEIPLIYLSDLICE